MVMPSLCVRLWGAFSHCKRCTKWKCWKLNENVGLPLWDVGPVGRLCCVLPVWNHPQGELKGFWAPFASSRWLCVLIPVFVFLQHAESLFGFFWTGHLSSLWSVSVVHPFPRLRRPRHEQCCLAWQEKKKSFLCLLLVDLSFDLKWLLAAASTASTTAGTMWASANPVCVVEWCAPSADLAGLILIKEKKCFNLLPLLLLEHLCFVGESPRRGCQESCSLRSVQCSSQGGDDAHPALRGSSVVFFLSSFWRKTSFSDSGFSPLLPRAGLWLRKNSWWKKDTSKRADGGGGGAYPFYYSIEHWSCYCWKYSLSLILFFLWLFLAVLITKTFLF